MNDLIDRAYRARRGSGLLDRLHGVGHLEDDRQARLNTAMAEYETAVKRGDDTAAAVADQRIDAVLDEARAARSAGQAEPETPAPVSFDGGVRRPAPAPVKPMSLQRHVHRELQAREAVAEHARHQHDRWW